MPKKITRPREKKQKQKKVTRYSHEKLGKKVKDTEKIRRFIDSWGN
ncbi:MAG: hypothetical protein G01um101429_652 [Parcubacteria group bacterium Gr01-1014_29]|nr:MAG: hypothetical protein G01um101429_652 [Parcubacteria group bacterium Gr01-1014_29]